MRKYLIAYSIWNKREMIGSILTGISASFPKERVDISFIFDGCSDGSFDIFSKIHPILLEDYSIKSTIFDEEKYEWKCHNFFLEEFSSNSKYDALIVCQDDVILKDPMLGKTLDSVLDFYKDEIGLITCRDGFNDLSYDKAIGNPWSEPREGKAKYLKVGEFQEIKIINCGPVIYPRSTVEKVGFLDSNFIYFYAEADYCFRCLDNGLKNIVIGTDLIHKKFDNVVASKIYDGTIAKKDIDYLQSKRR